ncbi:MAG: hypothetical protein LBI37_03155 [Puniceicoccales bacterium]|jgi:DNA-3-methyladenine glycosylase II|nr:hypothetical protein [Puniceicoccales bacterium]
MLMQVFEYSDEEIDYLKQRDPKLGVVIDRVGHVDISINENVFESIVISMISQQISKAAADSILKKLSNRFGGLSAGDICKCDAKALRECGLSERKASYMLGLGKAIVDGIVDFSNLSNLSNEAVIAELVKLKGVGVWTAEMTLIFSLGRKNIFSWRDLGIRKGLMKLNECNELSQIDIENYRAIYSPYCSIASFYLWKICHRK